MQHIKYLVSAFFENNAPYWQLLSEMGTLFDSRIRQTICLDMVEPGVFQNKWHQHIAFYFSTKPDANEFVRQHLKSTTAGDIQVVEAYPAFSITSYTRGLERENMVNIFAQKQPQIGYVYCFNAENTFYFVFNHDTDKNNGKLIVLNSYAEWGKISESSENDPLYPQRALWLPKKRLTPSGISPSHYCENQLRPDMELADNKKTKV